MKRTMLANLKPKWRSN